jgi:hypothetical protein
VEESKKVRQEASKEGYWWKEGKKQRKGRSEGTKDR